MMKITLEPTPETPITTTDGGSAFQVRVWRGRTSAGVEVEALVYSLRPVNPTDARRLRAELPDFVKQVKG